ncbi:hypothetical protein AAF712_003796 [Marasmius tenuissimus]|uniref:Uncharacterized protein n=1 Tax=Marasmius tenuissimus TaxID=585030 RepID=A0ABR3A6H5_9AGAR
MPSRPRPGCLFSKRSEPRNVTIDDSNPVILYTPAEGWSDERCTGSGCAHADVNVVSNGTFHFGVRSLEDPTLPLSSTSTPTSTGSPPDQTQDTEDHSGKGRGGGEDDENDDHSGRGGGGGGDDDNHAKRMLQPKSNRNLDEPVSLEFQFTAPSANVNLSFTLDNELVGEFVRSLTDNTTAATTGNDNVLKLENLPEEPHVLVAKLAPESVFLFDYLVYTTTLMSSSMGEIQPTSTPASSKSHKAATYGGIIGGVVGFLFIVSLATFVSIYRRRRRSAKQNSKNMGPSLANAGARPGIAQRFGEADHGLDDPPAPAANANDPEMGFVPRYFPGTILPLARREREQVPPPYEIPPLYDLERGNGRVGVDGDIGVQGREELVHTPTPTVTVSVEDHAKNTSNDTDTTTPTTTSNIHISHDPVPSTPTPHNETHSDSSINDLTPTSPSNPDTPPRSPPLLPANSPRTSPPPPLDPHNMDHDVDSEYLKAPPGLRP